MLAPNEAAYYVFNTQANQVQPERTENYQTGIVYKSGRITADGDLYLIDAQHFASQTTDSTGATYYRDNGGAQYKGVEAEVTYVLIKDWALYVNGTYNSGRFDSGNDANGNPHAGNAIGGTPRYTAVGGFVYDDERYFGSLLCKVTGDSWGTQGSDQVANPATGTAYTTNHVPTYEETDLVVGYRLPTVEFRRHARLAGVQARRQQPAGLARRHRHPGRSGDELRRDCGAAVRIPSRADDLRGHKGPVLVSRSIEVIWKSTPG